MRSNINLILAFMSIMILTSSCVVHYVPPPVNNPMLSRESEYQANISVGGGEYAQTTNINVAFSPVQNIGLGYSFSMYNTTPSSTNGVSNPVEAYKGRYHELMIGYYNSIGKYGVYEFYTGGGLGNSDNNYELTSTNAGNLLETSKLNFNRFFLMPSIGFKFKNVQGSIAAKVYRVGFSKVSYQNISNYDVLEELSGLKNTPYYFMDNAATLKFGHKNVHLMLQLAVTNKMSANIITYEQVRFTTGLQFQFYAKQ